MDAMFNLRSGALHVEDVPLHLVAERFGTPTYVYSRAALTGAYRAFESAFADALLRIPSRPAGSPAPLVCYAVKANPNLAILNLFARMGSGFDIVSAGELARVVAAGGDPSRVVFSGVGKSAEELRLALEAGILCFNIESIPELHRLERVAGSLGKVAPVSIRVNPDVNPNTHPYITTGLNENKFGVNHADALDLYRAARGCRHLRITGIDCHIGSQITEISPYADALERILELVDQLAAEGMVLDHVDLGGGLGIRYSEERPPSVDDYAAAITRVFGNRPQRLVFEPGRLMVGNAGLLLTRVEYLKPGPVKNFAIVDAAMNDLMRPALYEAYHDVLPVAPRVGDAQWYDVVGPVCESGDWLARNRALVIAEGDLLAIASAGAYGMSMSSNYNTRPRAAEVMVDGADMHEIRARERIEQLFEGESLLPR
ncbi:MAG: diaminopimelate decarboxylase [Rhodocyclaceae bacterium]|nr:diaminopimelate decarboxylase [Rhodocyclaceae bacterium]MCA3090328.1 diaminopimelate decarboxylase [Rhodocyclaceae bacterium]MCA3098967.1 diaminopimelate decarboxylase [Rhodocyclaceae bacterium]MCA3104138.1 diaminopimelate decarboxylase [Rhodocyclaceae bacterium]MCA3108381.1 diaminopimelate decarboxylase [Rhodocyclaceae bacterium]